MTLDRLALVALFAAVLANAACTPPSQYGPSQCASDADCGSDQHCPTACPGCLAACQPGAACRTNADCDAYSHCRLDAMFCDASAACTQPGAICSSGASATYFCTAGDPDDQPVCVDWTTNDACRALSPALDIGGASTCVPQDACTTNETCRAGERCIDRQCRNDPGCADDAACGDGFACVRGECLVKCDAGQPCPDITTCTVGACEWLTTPDDACAAGQLYYGGHCHVICNAARDCPLGFMCDAGLCSLDTRPVGYRAASTCAADAACAGGSRCVAGACRAACPGHTDAECQRADIALTRCDAQGICRP